MQSNQRMMSWRGVAKKRRKRESPKKTVKWSGSVARPQQSWRDGNDRFDHQALEQDVKWSLYYPCPAAFGTKIPPTARTGSRSIALRPGRLRHLIPDGSTASASSGQRANSDF